jgi:drug/metabolite transporter (DMT)-like permease
MKKPTARSGRRPVVSPYILLLLTMCFWAGNNVVAKAVVAGVPPAALVFWSWVIGVIALSPWALPHVLAQRDLVLRNWLKLVLIGSLGMNFAFHLFYNALTFTTAINATLIATIIPAVIVGLSWLLYREAITWRAGIGSAIAFAGVVVVIVRGDLAVLVALGFNSGDLLMIPTVLAWTLYTVLLRHTPPGLNPLAMLWVFAFAGVIVNGVIYISEVFSPMAFTVSWSVAAMIAYVAIFPSVLAFIFYNAGVKSLGPSIAGQFLYLTPVLTAILAVVLLGESFELYHLVGLAVIVLGLYLATTRADLLRPMISKIIAGLR